MGEGAMPEGDTLFRVAARLRPALEGSVVSAVRTPRRPGLLPPVGSQITAVRAHGKNLLIEFAHLDATYELRTHLRMTGSWHLYHTGGRWHRPARQAVVIIETEHWTAVCFNAPVVEIRTAGRRALAVAALGPDLCVAEADPVALLNTVLARLAELDPATCVAAALLDQRVAAGVGNVYKCEALFACGVHPRTPVGMLPAASRRSLWATARQQLIANLHRPGPRRTVPEGLAVYGRGARPCRVCGTAISREVIAGRSTYWCAHCQPWSAKADSGSQSIAVSDEP